MLGVRVVIGRCPVSPFGPVADAMVEDPAGRRVFIAQDEALAAYVSSIDHVPQVRRTSPDSSLARR